MEKLCKWKRGMELKGLRVNIGKTMCQVRRRNKSAQDKSAQTRARRQKRAVTKARTTKARRQNRVIF